MIEETMMLDNRYLNFIENIANDAYAKEAFLEVCFLNTVDILSYIKREKDASRCMDLIDDELGKTYKKWLIENGELGSVETNYASPEPELFNLISQEDFLDYVKIRYDITYHEDVSVVYVFDVED